MGRDRIKQSLRDLVLPTIASAYNMTPEKLEQYIKAHMKEDPIEILVNDVMEDIDNNVESYRDE